MATSGLPSSSLQLNSGENDSIWTLSSFPSEILGEIAYLAGLSSIQKLFQIGSRLLTQKLSSEAGITRLDNQSIFGTRLKWYPNMIIGLKGIKSLSLEFRKNAPPTSLCPSLIASLPQHIEEISFYSDASVSCWYNATEASKGHFPFDTRFPRLKSLSLSHCRDEYEAATEFDDVDVPKTQEDCFLAQHVEHLPVTLTRLHLGFKWHYYGGNDIYKLLPSTLQELTLGLTSIRGERPFMHLTELRTLQFPHLETWEVNVSRYSEVMTSLTRLELPKLRNWVNLVSGENLDSKDLAPLLSTLLVNLEYLDTTNFYLKMSSLAKLTKLKHLKCGFDFCDEDDIAAAVIPPNVVNMHVSLLRAGPFAGSYRDHFRCIPRSTQTLKLPYLKSYQIHDDMRYLPSTITSLKVRWNREAELRTLIFLPKTLTSLYSSGASNETPIELLKQLPRSLKFYRSGTRKCFEAYLRLEEPLSDFFGLDDSGWTSIQFAAGCRQDLLVKSMLECDPMFGKSLAILDGKQSVQFMISNISLDLLRWLVFEHCLDASTWYQSPGERFSGLLDISIKTRRYDILNWLIHEVKYVTFDDLPDYAAVTAAATNDIQLLEWLHQGGFDFDRYAKYELFRLTPLSVAVSRRQDQAVQWLMDHGACRIQFEVILSRIVRDDSLEVANYFSSLLSSLDMSLVTVWSQPWGSESLAAGLTQSLTTTRPKLLTGILDWLVTIGLDPTSELALQHLTFLVEDLKFDEGYSECIANWLETHGVKRIN